MEAFIDVSLSRFRTNTSFPSYAFMKTGVWCYHQKTYRLNPTRGISKNAEVKPRDSGVTARSFLTGRAPPLLAELTGNNVWGVGVKHRH
jgi:hypothetical protein